MAGSQGVELIKIMLLGDGGVGKSVLTIQFTSNKFIQEYDPTVENCYRKTVNVDGKICVLDVLDTAGREEYQAMVDPYIRQTNGFMIVYSVIDEKSFETVPKYLDRILRIKEETQMKQVLIVANKIDLQENRKITTQEGRSFSQQKGVSFIETSAKKRINVEEAFNEIVRITRKDGFDDKEQLNKKRKCVLL